MGNADVDEQEDEQCDDAEELYEEDLVEGRDDSKDLEVFGESGLTEQMDGLPTHSNVDPCTELAHTALEPAHIQLLADDEIIGALSESIRIPSTSSSLSLGCLAGCDLGRSLLLQTFTEELCLAAQISDEFDEFDTPPFPTGRVPGHDGLLDEDRTTAGTTTDLIEVEDEERLDIDGGVQGSSGAVIEEDLEVLDDSLHGYEQAALEDGFEIEHASEDSSNSSCYEASEDSIIAPGESSTSGSVLPSDIIEPPPASPVFCFDSDDRLYCSLLTQTFSDELNLAGEISDDFGTGDIPPFPRSRPRSAQSSETQAEECLQHEDEAASIYSTEDIAHSYPSSIPASPPHTSIAYSAISPSPESLSPSLSFLLQEGYANGLGLLLMDQTFTEELDSIARPRDCVLGDDMSSAQETDKLAVHVTLENRYPNIAPCKQPYNISSSNLTFLHFRSSRIPLELANDISIYYAHV